MNREEAKRFLQSRIDLIKSDFPSETDYLDALVLAVNALEQQPMIFKSSTLDTEKLEKCRQSIKEQIEDGVVLLPYYIDIISPYESNTEQLYVSKEPPVYKESEGNI